LADVQSEAMRQSVSMLQKYPTAPKSLPFEQTFKGKFAARSDKTKLAVLAGGDFKLYVDDREVLNTENPSAQFAKQGNVYVIPGLWDEGEASDLTLEYTETGNTKAASTLVGGVTLFAYNGGGEMIASTSTSVSGSGGPVVVRFTITGGGGGNDPITNVKMEEKEDDSAHATDWVDKGYGEYIGNGSWKWVWNTAKHDEGTKQSLCHNGDHDLKFTVYYASGRTSTEDGDSVNVNNLVITSVDPEGVVAWSGQGSPVPITVSLTDNDLSDDVGLTLKLYSSTDGSLVQTLTGSTDSGSYQFSWNGQKSDQTTAPAGTYTYEVEAYQTDVNEAESVSTHDEARFLSPYLTVSGLVGAFDSADDNDTPENMDDDTYIYTLEYTRADSRSSNASTGEVWLFDPNWQKTAISWNLASQDCTLGAHSLTHEINTSALSSFGAYQVVLNMVDNNAAMYRNHGLRPAKAAASTMGSGLYLAPHVDITVSDLFTSSGVLEKEEEDPGAFAHFNVDNDNDSDNSLPSSKHPGGDYYTMELAQSSNENDLVEAKINFAAGLPHVGTAVLKVQSLAGSRFPRLWETSTKGSALIVRPDGETTCEKEWDLSDASEYADFDEIRQSFWIEGRDCDGTWWIEAQYKDSSSSLEASDKAKCTFIAADCGNQPKTEPFYMPCYDHLGNFVGNYYMADHRQLLQGTWPLVDCEFSVLSDCWTQEYNCIASSVDEDNWWYEPVSSIPGFRIKGIDEEFGDNDGIYEISDMDAFYLSKKGWTPTASGPSDAEAMYYTGYHGARRSTCGCGAGKWIMYASKLGGTDKIEHIWDQVNNGSGYGTPTRFYK
ncbi:MAG: FlgD immunoglobulin-like domain containing protein, partial [Armatimonadota bacterium]